MMMPMVITMVVFGDAKTRIQDCSRPRVEASSWVKMSVAFGSKAHHTMKKKRFLTMTHEYAMDLDPVGPPPTTRPVASSFDSEDTADSTLTNAIETMDSSAGASIDRLSSALIKKSCSSSKWTAVSARVKVRCVNIGNSLANGRFVFNTVYVG